MPEILSPTQIKLNNGQIIAPQQGGWYDGQQYWNGTFSSPGVINPLSNQPGAGSAVSPEVNAQTSVAAGLAPGANQAFIDAEKARIAATGTPGGSPAVPGGGVATPGASGAGAGVGFTPAPTLNLPDLYKSLYASSGISTLESDLSKKTEEYNAARAKIADNPFLSEATLTGRLKKLSDSFDMSIANVKNDIATKKADVETQLNLQTKQFDINSQAAQQALSQFNTLLSMGALNSASGEDIANITRSTGLSSAAIYSAISASKAKDVKTSVLTSTDDNGNVTASVINTDTGAIIKQTSLGKIDQSKAAPATQTKAQEDVQNRENLITSIKNYNDLRNIMGTFSGIFTPDEIYQLYNMYSPFGPANETIEEVKQGLFATK